ncbi:MAG: hypothetical protein VX262_02625 [Acidobacteriota bacterium]|nr:hypothetical protein [Acidobacteriota bacterium]|tara:strand:+ start:429 stop:632 length:204 start_codon:yes stop_codon:yes gene_type:complete
MHLYVEPMDSVLVEFDTSGQVKFKDENWCLPSLQETRAILYAAENEMAALTELVESLESTVAPIIKT